MFVPRRVVSSLFIPVFLALRFRLPKRRRLAAASWDASSMKAAACCQAFPSPPHTSPPARAARRNFVHRASSRFPICRSGRIALKQPSGIPPQRATSRSLSRVFAGRLEDGRVHRARPFSAAPAALDTVSTALNNVISPKQVQDLPLNGRNFVRLLQLTPGAAGTGDQRQSHARQQLPDRRRRQQRRVPERRRRKPGGVSGIAGTLLPIDAIDQFSVQAGGGAEQGRNSGASVNLVIKSGTNEFHGSAYYFNRHESLAAQSPIVAPDSPKRQIRNNQGGFSLGGPIVHNKSFFFATFESQRLTAGNTTATTTPSPDG